MAIGLFTAGTRITAALLNSIAPLAVIKPSDQSLTSNTTLQNDSALFVPVVASATYLFQFYLDYEGNTGAGNALKAQFTVPAGATLRYGVFRTLSGAASPPVTFAAASSWQADGGGAGVLEAVSGFGSLVMSSTAGNLQLQWAQGGSTAVATIVHAQSTVTLWRVT